MSRPRSLTRGWLILFPVLIAVAHHLAIAEPLRCTQDLVCRSHLDQGVSLDLARKYEPALREFQAAYQRQKDPRVAINVGRTLHKLGRFSDALSWYKAAGRAAPADTELQKQIQEFTAQAKQNLPEEVGVRAPVSLVNQPTFAVLTSPINLTTATTNNNTIQLELGAMHSDSQPVHKPPYRRALLWVPLIGVVLAASAAGIAAASWPRPWQPDPQVPSSVFSVATAGGAK